MFPPLIRSPSLFFGEDDALPIPCHSQPDVQEMYLKEFFDSCRVSHLCRVVAHHPSYLRRSLDLQHFLMRGEGPLPPAWRHFIAIMACSQHDGAYVFTIQREEFLQVRRASCAGWHAAHLTLPSPSQNGGDPRWLQGLAHAPRKLQALAELNALLAHQPWLLRPEHMASLLRGEEAWSVTELVHAIVILITFQCLASLAWGLGIVMELGSGISDEEVRRRQRQASGGDGTPLLPVGHLRALMALPMPEDIKLSKEGDTELRRQLLRSPVEPAGAPAPAEPAVELQDLVSSESSVGTTSGEATSHSLRNAMVFESAGVGGTVAHVERGGRPRPL